MAEPRAQQLDVEMVVVERFQQYLDIHDELPLSGRLLDDFGIDSIVFVTILMDLADELDLDLSAVTAKLEGIRTLEEVVGLVHSVRRPELHVDQAGS